MTKHLNMTIEYQYNKANDNWLEIKEIIESEKNFLFFKKNMKIETIFTDYWKYSVFEK